MATKRKKSKSKTANGVLLDILAGPNVRLLIGGSVALTALLYLNDNVFRPIYESGPPPFPARAEVDKLRDETTMSFDSVRKSIDKNSEVANRLSQKIQQDSAEARASRLNRLIGQRTQLTALIDMNPNDNTLKGLLEQTNTQIIQLQTEIAREIGQPINTQQQSLSK